MLYVITKYVTHVQLSVENMPHRNVIPEEDKMNKKKCIIITFFPFLLTFLQKIPTVQSAFRKHTFLQAEVSFNQGLLEVSFRESQVDVGCQVERAEPFGWDVRFPELRADSLTTSQTNTHICLCVCVCACLCTSTVL